ncbi:MAG: ROK family protein [Planctomycetes bacterium]|nr:ROK family protein [Planctomycetota bacterium]
MIGVDLGGTKIECAVLRADGTIPWRDRVATPQGDYRGTLEAVAALVDQAIRHAPEAPGVGVAWPGSTSPFSGLHRNANSTCLNGKPLREDLQRRLARPVRGSNDANCFALSEAVDGAGRDASTVFGVILGTGCGGGVVVRGRILDGCNGIAGEWGHMPLPGATAEERVVPGCWCGRGPCLEVFLSGPGVEADHVRLGGSSDDRLPAIAQAAGRGDAVATAAMDRWIDRLGRSLAVVCNLLDPDVIVLGGGASLVPGLAARLPESIRPHAFTDALRTRVVAAMHGDSSGVRGAARLFATLPA